jgi:LmbE family N-acetylglucosaminyl deacetylase
MMNNTVLIIAAHPDDEVLGCGGTIAKHIATDDIVHIIFMTNGVNARDNGSDKDTIIRSSALNQAMTALGVTGYQSFDFPDNKMDSVPLLSIIKTIEKAIFEYQPNIVYTHFAHDLNIDHQITHKAVMTACRPVKESSVKKILSFEVLSSTEWNSPSQQTFIPHYIVDISDFWEQKLEALKCYQNEMRSFPHSRSYKCIEALSIVRGATNGFNKAEAFFVERILE